MDITFCSPPLNFATASSCLNALHAHSHFISSCSSIASHSPICNIWKNGGLGPSPGEYWHQALSANVWACAASLSAWLRLPAMPDHLLLAANCARRRRQQHRRGDLSAAGVPLACLPCMASLAGVSLRRPRINSASSSNPMSLSYISSSLNISCERWRWLGCRYVPPRLIEQEGHLVNICGNAAGAAAPQQHNSLLILIILQPLL